MRPCEMQAYKMHARERDTSIRYCHGTVGVVGNSMNVRPSYVAQGIKDVV